MTGQVTLAHLSAQLKVYLLILHTIVIGWIVHILITVFHNSFGSNRKHVANIGKDPSSVRVVHVGDKRVTVESCHWLNSILYWLYLNASNTPDLLKIWLTMLNEKLKTDKVPTTCLLMKTISESFLHIISFQLLTCPTLELTDTFIYSSPDSLQVLPGNETLEFYSASTNAAGGLSQHHPCGDVTLCDKNRL